MTTNQAVLTGPQGNLWQSWGHALSVAWGIVQYGRRATNKTKLLAGLWNFIDPLVTIIAYYFLLVQIFNFREEGFILHLFLSITLHRFAMSSLMRGTSAFIRYKSLIMSGVLTSKNVVIYATLLDLLMDMAIALVIFLLTAVLMGIRPTVEWVALAPMFLVFILFSVGCMYLLSCVGVYWRDTQSVMGIATRLLLFLSPVLYPISRIPEEYLWIYMLNPFACFYHTFRQVILEGTWPDQGYFLYTLVLAVVLLVVGRLVFVRLEGKASRYW